MKTIAEEIKVDIIEMESGNSNPQLNTILKVLAAMGKTLAIVPIPAKEY